MSKYIAPPGFDEETARRRSAALAAASCIEYVGFPRVHDADSLMGALVLAALPDGTFYARPSGLSVLAWMTRDDRPDDETILKWREELLSRGEVTLELGIWNCYARSPELMLRISELRRFQRFNSRRVIPTAIRQAVFDRDGNVCQECAATETLSLDHIHPWSMHGPDTVENLRVLCRSCNSRKGAKVL